MMKLLSFNFLLTFKFISLLHWWRSPFPEAAKTPKGFPGWGTNGGANPILAGCLFFETVKIKKLYRRPTQAAPVSRGEGGPPEGDERRGR